MGKKAEKKLRKVCLHCEFYDAAKRKYPAWAAAGRNPHPDDSKVNRDMLLSVAHIVADMTRQGTDEDKKLFDKLVSMFRVRSVEDMFALIESQTATKQ